jgi:superfamily II DNA helicase RecQ
MDQFNTIFAYSPTHRIAICKSHQQGVVKSQLRTHLDTKHQELVPNTRRQVVHAVDQEASLQAWAMNYEEVIYPRPASQPLPHLPVYHDGLQCNTCAHVYRHIKRMQEHCRQEHGWVNKSQPRGRPASKQTMWTTKISCQKFHTTNKLGRLFEVSATAEAQPAPVQPDGDVSQAIQAAFTQASQQLDALEKEKNNIVKPDSDRFEFAEWLNRAGWARHLKGLKREWLLTMAQQPTPRERALTEICWAARMVMWRAQQASTSSVVGMPAMMYINRREVGSGSNEKPFNAQQTGKTMDKYSSVWVSIIAFIWRTHELPVVRQRSDDQDVQGRRPPYHVTGKQDMWLQKIKGIVGEDTHYDDQDDDWFREPDTDDESDEERLNDAQTEALEDHVSQFMLALLDHVLGDNEYTSALISGMAVLGISVDNGWLSALVYTPKQSAVIAIARMLVLYRSTQMRQQAVAKLVEEGWGGEDAAVMAPSHFEYVQEMANRFMTLTEYNGKPTPVDAILRLRAFGFKIRFTTNADGVIDWMGDTLLYGNIQFSMPQVRSMVHGMIAGARQHVLSELMLLQVDSEGAVVENTTALPTIDWRKLVDNAAEQQVGWSFMEDPRNHSATSVADPKQWLGQRVVDEKELRRRFVDMEATRAALATGGGVVWLQGRVKAYSTAMKEARSKLAALVHMTGGAPPRGTELVTVKHSNTANGDSRGIFIEDGLVVFVTKYHKNVGQTGKGKVIHRYLPREVGELVVFYLWFARPFWQQVEGAVQGRAVDVSAYVWEPEPEQRWQQPERKRKRKRQRVAEEDDDGEVEEDKACQGQGWVETWNSNRVRHAIERASLQHMGVKMNIMGWRHSTKAAYRRYIKNDAAVKAFADAANSDDESDRETDQPWDIQTGHGTTVAGMIYGRPVTEPVFSVEAKRFGLRLASMEWHAFLQIPSVIAKKARKGTQAAATRREAVEEEYRRWKRMRLVDVDAELRKLIGDGATFRSVQKPAIQAIMQHKSPVVVVMGTGAGKSVLFMLPASVSSGLTVVVVPLVALRGDMKARCDALNIVSAEWDSRRPHEWAQIMFVTPESAVGEAFGHFINRQRLMGRLDRIVMDECHAVLDSVGGFRSRMLALRQLVRVETQMVYLTATLRPRDEEQFIELMGLPGKQQGGWFRGKTTRKNIGYSIHEYDVEEEEDAVRALVARLQRKYPPPSQIVVYCGTIARTKRMAAVLDAVCFHREVGSAAKKKEIVRQLTSGEQHLFTATNALGLGVDAAHIRVVLHVGTVRQIRQYGQESGRAGRQGEASEAIIMRGYRTTARGRVAVGFAEDVEEEMQAFIGGEGCMRRVMDEAMDGTNDRWECEVDEEACQRCRRGRGRGGGRGRGDEAEGRAERMTGERVEFEQQRRGRQGWAAQEAEQQRKEMEEVERLGELVEEWRVGCQLCRAWGEEEVGHGLEACEHEEADGARDGIERLRACWVVVPFSCCYECGLPQAICTSFAMDIQEGGYRKQKGVECEYRGVLSKVFIVGIMAGGEPVWKMIRDAMQADREAAGWEKGDGARVLEKVVQWGCKKRRWGGIEGNNMSWIIVQIITEIEG